MYSVPPLQADPDFWYWYQITLKCLAWSLIGIHLALFFWEFWDLISKDTAGWFPAGLGEAYFVIYDMAVIVFGLALTRISLN